MEAKQKEKDDANYINLILDELQGDTPKQKYEALKKLQDERTTYWSKANHAHLNFRTLADDPVHSDMHSLFEALANTTNVSE
jgi:hypothetical protein